MSPASVARLARHRDYDHAVGRLRFVALRLLWSSVRGDRDVLADYIREAREALNTIETTGKATLRPGRVDQVERVG